MTKQEAVQEQRKPLKRRLGGIIVRMAYIAFYIVSLLLLLACVGAWIASFQGDYYQYSVDLPSLRRIDKTTIFYQRYGYLGFKDGEAIIQIGENLWDLTNRPPKTLPRAISFSSDRVSDPIWFESIVPQRNWHNFRYEISKSPPDSALHLLGSSYDSIGFPFWSAFAVLLIPFLILAVRGASRKVFERRRGFTPILNA